MHPLTLTLLLLTLAAFPADAACPPVRRSAAVVRQFRRTHPCPSTGQTHGSCRGWVVDHIWPLCANGADHIDNLVWSPVNEAKLKDRWEKTMCRRLGCLHRGD